MVTNRDRKSFGSCWKIAKVAQTIGTIDVFIHVQAFQNPLHRELLHVQISMNDDPICSCEMTSCSAIDLAEIWLSSKISSWIWSIIIRMVMVLCHPRRGTQVEKSCLKWATQFLTANDGARSPNVSIRMAWISLGALPCFAGKKYLMTAHISMLLKSCASPDMHPFSLCNKKRLEIRHMNRPLFPVTLSIPSYNIGKYVRLRTCQHPIVGSLYIP